MSSKGNSPVPIAGADALFLHAQGPSLCQQVGAVLRMVVTALGLFPFPVQRRIAVRLYQGRWFNLLVSVFPGVRHGNRLLGARVEEVYPVLPLADGTGLAIGVMTWERSLSVGILADATLVPDVDQLAAGFTGVFGGYRAAARR
jgi:diacylglycerol O-acyltransferase